MESSKIDLERNKMLITLCTGHIHKLNVLKERYKEIISIYNRNANRALINSQHSIKKEGLLIDGEDYENFFKTLGSDISIFLDIRLKRVIRKSESGGTITTFLEKFEFESVIVNLEKLNKIVINIRTYKTDYKHYTVSEKFIVILFELLNNLLKIKNQYFQLLSYLYSIEDIIDIRLKWLKTEAKEGFKNLKEKIRELDSLKLEDSLKEYILQLKDAKNKIKNLEDIKI